MLLAAKASSICSENQTATLARPAFETFGFPLSNFFSSFLLLSNKINKAGCNRLIERCPSFCEIFQPPNRKACVQKQLLGIADLSVRHTRFGPVTKFKDNQPQLPVFQQALRSLKHSDFKSLHINFEQINLSDFF